MILLQEGWTYNPREISAGCVDIDECDKTFSPTGKVTHSYQYHSIHYFTNSLTHSFIFSAAPTPSAATPPAGSPASARLATPATPSSTATTSMSAQVNTSRIHYSIHLVIKFI